jgi:hypothetical protein
LPLPLQNGLIVVHHHCHQVPSSPLNAPTQRCHQKQSL